MTREIKFRAYELKNPYDDKVGQQMYYGVETAYDTLGSMKNTKGEDIEYWWSSFGDVLNAVEDGDLALMQYTGLKDKNGKEIYEGDIVRSGNWIAEVPSINEFILQAMTYGQSMTDYTRTIVIGNIYENPELIK